MAIKYALIQIDPERLLRAPVPLDTMDDCNAFEEFLTELWGPPALYTPDPETFVYMPELNGPREEDENHRGQAIMVTFLRCGAYEDYGLSANWAKWEKRGEK